MAEAVDSKRESKPQACIGSGVVQLFHYARRSVTAQDILDFAPGDPGYGHYVRVYTEFLEKGQLPDLDGYLRESFNISETIVLITQLEPYGREAGDRFRRFRVFANSVGLALPVSAFHCEGPSLNLVLMQLLRDAVALNDPTLNELMGIAIAERRAELQAKEDDLGLGGEFAFFSLSLLILATLPGGNKVDVEGLVSQFRADEVRGFSEFAKSKALLWSSEYNNFCNDVWFVLVKTHLMSSEAPLLQALGREILAEV